MCHSGAKPKAGIDMSSYASLKKGGEEGPVITDGDPAKSKLVMAIRHQPGAKAMPPKGQLTEDQMKTIEAWIKDGAKEK